MDDTLSSADVAMTDKLRPMRLLLTTMKEEEDK